MIFGTYPCCDGPLFLAVPEETPKFVKEQCPHCKAMIWHKLSRIQPESYLESDFLALYEVNEANMSISRRKIGQNC